MSILFFYWNIYRRFNFYAIVLTCSIILYLKVLKWNNRNKIENRKDFWSNESNISVTSRLKIVRCFNNYNLCNNSWVDRNIEFLTLKFNCEKLNLFQRVNYDVIFDIEKFCKLVTKFVLLNCICNVLYLLKVKSFRTLYKFMFSRSERCESNGNFDKTISFLLYYKLMF